MQKYKIFGTQFGSLVWREDNLAESVEECNTVLKEDFIWQLLTMLLSTLHVGSKHLLYSSRSVIFKIKQICRNVNAKVTGHQPKGRCKKIRGEESQWLTTLRDHWGQLEVSPIGSLRSLVQIRWKRLGSSQAWGSLVSVSLHTSPIDLARGVQ